MSGIVVRNRNNSMQYAISEKNFNPTVHVKVRDLKPGETVLGYKPKRVETKKNSPRTRPARSAKPASKTLPKKVTVEPVVGENEANSEDKKGLS